MNKDNKGTKEGFSMTPLIDNGATKKTAKPALERKRVGLPDDLSNTTIPSATKTENEASTTPAKKQKKSEPEPKNPYFEPNKSAKLSEDVIMKVKILMPFIQKKTGQDLRALNSFIDIAIDHYVESALEDNEQETFKQIYEASTALKKNF